MIATKFLTALAYAIYILIGFVLFILLAAGMFFVVKFILMLLGV